MAPSHVMVMMGTVFLFSCRRRGDGGLAWFRNVTDSMMAKFIAVSVLNTLWHDEDEDSDADDKAVAVETKMRKKGRISFIVSRIP